jgi:hypothetical protein
MKIAILVLVIAGTVLLSFAAMLLLVRYLSID